MDASDVRDLLLPGTPDSVAERYLALAERAKTCSFDVLEEDVVVLDTETTGLSFRDCELIEIAAARISGREVTERFQTFVRPSRPIPKEIQELTNISELDVADAPDAQPRPWLFSPTSWAACPYSRITPRSIGPSSRRSRAAGT